MSLSFCSHDSLPMTAWRGSTLLAAQRLRCIVPHLAPAIGQEHQAWRPERPPLALVPIHECLFQVSTPLTRARSGRITRELWTNSPGDLRLIHQGEFASFVRRGRNAESVAWCYELANSLVPGFAPGAAQGANSIPERWVHLRIERIR